MLLQSHFFTTVRNVPKLDYKNSLSMCKNQWSNTTVIWLKNSILCKFVKYMVALQSILKYNYYELSFSTTPNFGMKLECTYYQPNFIFSP